MRLKNFSTVTWAFFGANAIYAIGFMLTAWTPFRSKSSLYEALDAVWGNLPESWSAVGLLAIILSLLAAWLDSRPFGVVGCTLGIGVWLYATLIYFQTGYYVVGGSVAMLYLSFWVDFYFSYISKVTANIDNQHRH